MPLITDWLMVGITAVYVVATVFICIYNGRSAKATREQVAESERQFEETKRLECMPFLQLEVTPDVQKPMFEIEIPFFKEDAEDTIYAILWLKNLGNGTATNIVYSWKCTQLNIADAGYPPINAIMRGDKYCFQLTFEVDDDDTELPSSLLVFQYDDLLGNTYEQQAVLCFEERELIRCEMNPPTFLGQVFFKKSSDDKKE